VRRPAPPARRPRQPHPRRQPRVRRARPIRTLVVLLLDHEPGEDELRRIQAQENAREPLSPRDQQEQFRDCWQARAGLPEADRMAAVCAELGITAGKGHSLRRQLPLPAASTTASCSTPPSRSSTPAGTSAPPTAHRRPARSGARPTRSTQSSTRSPPAPRARPSSCASTARCATAPPTAATRRHRPTADKGARRASSLRGRSFASDPGCRSLRRAAAARWTSPRGTARAPRFRIPRCARCGSAGPLPQTLAGGGELILRAGHAVYR
jgi:hypothetical protein